MQGGGRGGKSDNFYFDRPMDKKRSNEDEADLVGLEVDKESETDSEGSDSVHTSEADSEEQEPWIVWHCSHKGNKFLCEVEESYIQDDFNLTHLHTAIPWYEYALDMILDTEAPEDDDVLTEEHKEQLNSSAEILYGLIHARYITTPSGLSAMLAKYKKNAFGFCPRSNCEKQPCLPVGLSDSTGGGDVKKFCPRCCDVYEVYRRPYTYPWPLDGAYFGTTFPHLFLMTFPHLQPPRVKDFYTPRIFGFQLHHTAKPGASRNAALRIQAGMETTEQQKRQGAKGSVQETEKTPAAASNHVS